MGWRDLLQEEEETICLPWTGGRTLPSTTRAWTIRGKLPEEHGWYEFSVKWREAKLVRPTEPDTSAIKSAKIGYLVGDRLVPEYIRVEPSPQTISTYSERVYLIEEGLDRFVRVSAGRVYDGGPLIYIGQEFPTGPESEVMDAFLDQKKWVNDIRGVCPALDAAFRMETWQREEAERRRQELERLRREEEERLAREARRQELAERLGDGAGRREMAVVDFNEAARAALAVGGATLLDVRNGRRGEKAVRYRLDNRRYECICDEKTLRIIDAGICLTDHRTGRKWDNLFTLESLPAVIRQGDREDRLVVFRHV